MAAQRERLAWAELLKSVPAREPGVDPTTGIGARQGYMALASCMFSQLAWVAVQGLLLIACLLMSCRKRMQACSCAVFAHALLSCEGLGGGAWGSGPFSVLHAVDWYRHCTSMSLLV